jgi:hypothetical protein
MTNTPLILHPTKQIPKGLEMTPVIAPHRGDLDMMIGPDLDPGTETEGLNDHLDEMLIMMAGAIVLEHQIQDPSIWH